MVVNVYNRYLFLYMKNQLQAYSLQLILLCSFLLLAYYEALHFSIRHRDEIHTSWDRYNFAKLVIE